MTRVLSLKTCRVWLAAAVLGAASASTVAADQTSPARGVWARAAKTGIGTAYEPYVNGQAAGRSRVWFSVADGMLTETMYGLIHQAQIKTARLEVATSAGLAVEGQGMSARTSYLYTDKTGRPLAPAYRLVTRDKAGTVEIEKHIFTDPDRNVLFMRVIVRPLKGRVTAYLRVEPHMGDQSVGNVAEASTRALIAHRGADFLTVRMSRPFAAAEAAPLAATGHAAEARIEGEATLTGQLGRASAKTAVYDLAFGFGGSAAESDDAARATLKSGYARVLHHYEGRGGAPGWRTYLAGLKELPRLAAQSEDGGRLAYASALALKVQEDKTHAGALIASLSNPWGDTVSAAQPSTGYKAVWPRDFYQCAMALAALGDRDTPVAAFRYLRTVQVKAETPGNSGAVGWFQQKSQVDGTAEWKGVQLDQTAMPIMLGWKLWKLGLIDAAELKARYADMIQPAAAFLATGGTVALLDNRFEVKPLYTQQERWEEQQGYSPSTSAAVVTGLTAAAEIAALSGDAANAALYQATADQFSSQLETLMFTTKGGLGDGSYYLRIADAPSPDQPGLITPRNGLSAIGADRLMDAGFLELVRYGVRRADDPHVLKSLKVIDDQTLPEDLRVRYDFHLAGGVEPVPGFRRYGHDGYGEDQVTGGNYGADHGAMSPGQRGRVWPLLTGERGHYALALAGLHGRADDAAIDQIRRIYVRGMERFANEGLMLPEQVFDGVGADLPGRPAPGQGAGSATPLAWAHAEYIKLLRSLSDRQVFDRYAPVQERYAR